MDSHDEMMVATLMEEAVVATDDDEHLRILSCLLGLQTRDAQPWPGGSEPGSRKSKPR
jgi:hypothetical protein